MRVLIVEDQKEIARFLKSSLEAECFAVDVAQDGERGLYLARTNDYDIIVLDNILPKKQGIEICKELRTTNSTTPILVLSVQSATDNKIQMLNAGADDYLIKPFSFEELLARVHALLRRPKNVMTEKLSVGDLELDTRKHAVVRAGENIYLTRKEFMLLEYLMRNHGT